MILNGHEHVACQADKAAIRFTKEGNCFTQISDAAGLAKIADTLSGPQTSRVLLDLQTVKSILGPGRLISTGVTIRGRARARGPDDIDNYFSKFCDQRLITLPRDCVCLDLASRAIDGS